VRAGAILLLTVTSCHRRARVALDQSVWCAQAQQRQLFSPTGAGPAAALAASLGRPQTFLIGVGNDLDGAPPEEALAYTLPVAVDLHYAYLTGLDGRGGWTEWNPDGSFVDRILDADRGRCVLSVFTLYAMAEDGEDSPSVLTDDDYMAAYWAGIDRLVARLEGTGGPVVVHLEPDFWGFMQKRGAPGDIPAQVQAHQPACADLPDDVSGLGRCMVRRLQSVDGVFVGLHASAWAGSAAETAAFLSAVGGDDADLIVVETLDRDAGCFEEGREPHCQREGGPWYWSETDFAAHLDWAGALHSASEKPLLWWQMPMGVPRHRPGGKEGTYRDNRVQYLFGNPEVFVAAGGIGAVFGKGADDQTDLTSDGGQFQKAARAYYAAPVALP